MDDAKTGKSENIYKKYCHIIIHIQSKPEYIHNVSILITNIGIRTIAAFFFVFSLVKGNRSIKNLMK